MERKQAESKGNIAVSNNLNTAQFTCYQQNV